MWESATAILGIFRGKAGSNLELWHPWEGSLSVGGRGMLINREKMGRESETWEVHRGRVSLNEEYTVGKSTVEKLTNWSDRGKVNRGKVNRGKVDRLE